MADDRELSNSMGVAQHPQELQQMIVPVQPKNYQHLAVEPPRFAFEHELAVADYSIYVELLRDARRPKQPGPMAFELVVDVVDVVLVVVEAAAVLALARVKFGAPFPYFGELSHEL